MRKLCYLLVIVICSLPMIPGLLGVLLSSWGFIPPLGMTEFTANGYAQMLAWSGVKQSLVLTLASAVISTALATLFCFAILQTLWLSRHWQRVENLLAPLLALPHVAFAIGFAFLLAPTGMLARLTFALFDWQTNPNGQPLFIHDPYALGLTLALAIKELPFLLLMSIPVLQQLKVSQSHDVATMLGYSPAQMWLKVIFPQWLSKMRFAIFAVIAYSIAVVDVALIIGPSNPPTFAVLVWQWFNDPDLSTLPRASAGAVTLFFLASGAMLLVVLVEETLTRWCHQWQFSGRRGWALPGKTLFSGVILLATSMIPLLLLWSVAQRWRFPDLIPTQWSLRFWQLEWQGIVPIVLNSVGIAIISATLALLLALIAQEYKANHQRHLPDYVIALPMLIPQPSLLFGLQILALYISSEQFWLWVTWSHLFFAFPFIYLALDGPWKSYDQHYSKMGLSLGKSPVRVLVQIKLRLLMPAIFYAWAVGISVSLAQYLPTLMLGGGRISTLTTEAVALSSGFDRRVTAIYALWQAFLPLIFFSIALFFGRLSRLRPKPLINQRAIYDSISQ